MKYLAYIQVAEETGGMVEGHCESSSGAMSSGFSSAAGHGASLGITGHCWASLGTTEYHWASPGITGCHWTSLGGVCCQSSALMSLGREIEGNQLQD